MQNNKIYTRDDFTFWTTMRTRWGDMDGLRHINHAAYLGYIETARLDFYNHLGFEYNRWQLDSSSILASMKIDYLKQISHPTKMEIGQSITRIGTTSFDFATAIFRENDDTPIIQGLFTMVAFNYALNKAIPVPDIFRAALVK